MIDQLLANELNRDDLLWVNIKNAFVTWASSIMGYPM